MAEQITADSVAFGILAEAGFKPPDMKQFARNLKSSKPNIDNILGLGQQRPGDEGEMAFGADGMPILGTFPNSYDRAPEEYARTYGPYPRHDSPSREAASEHGGVINEGAARHLTNMYPKALGLLATLAAQKRQELDIPESEKDRPLTPQETQELLGGVTHMWSLLAFRKKDRFPKDQLPPEVAFLRRTMLGMSMSLSRLFLPEEAHGFRRKRSWEGRPFSTESWARTVEESGLLVSETERDPVELCPASSGMIKHVIDTLVDPPQAEIPAVDMEAEYGASAADVLAYGKACVELTHARVRRVRYSYDAHDEVVSRVSVLGPLTQQKLDALHQHYVTKLRSDAVRLENDIAAKFDTVVSLLGYNPEKFQAAQVTY